MFDLSKVADGVGLLNYYIGVWENFGYHNPPSPDSVRVRPLGQRTEEAITGARDAVVQVDSVIADLTAIKDQLVAEIRRDEDWRRPPAADHEWVTPEMARRRDAAAAAYADGEVPE